MPISKKIYSLILVIIMLFSLINASAEELTLEEIRQSLVFSSFSSGQSVSDVTEGFYLPVYYNGAFIVWESDNENVLRIEGSSDGLKAIVMRPPFGEGYATAGLTAYISKNDEFVKKSFLVRIRELDIGYKYSTGLIDAYNRFELEFLTAQNIFAVEKDLVLPDLTSFDRVSISCWSDNPSVLTDEGKISRSYENAGTAEFYVCFTDGFETFKTSYKINIKAYSDDDIRNIAADDLDVIINSLSDKYNLASLDENLSLPLTTKNNSEVVWSSSDSSVISDKGIINPGSSMKSATLTVSVTSHGLVTEKTLNVTVAPKKSTPTVSKGNSGIGGGGSSGSSGSQNSGNVPEAPKPLFNDVASGHWAYDAVTSLAEKGIINGMADGVFAPDMLLTREQAVKLILPALGIPVNSKVTESSFADCRSGEWYVPYVEAAKSSGVVTGLSETEFGTGKNITRQELATMIVRALKYCSVFLPAVSEVQFDDAESIASWASEAVTALASAGIVKGSDNCFSPENFATRAETAVMLHRIISINTEVLD